MADRKSHSVVKRVKVFSSTDTARNVVGNFIFHTTIITNFRIWVNLFKQDHGHQHSLGDKSGTDCDNVQGVFKHHCSHKQEH